MYFETKKNKELYIFLYILNYDLLYKDEGERITKLGNWWVGEKLVETCLWVKTNVGVNCLSFYVYVLTLQKYYNLVRILVRGWVLALIRRSLTILIKKQ